MIVIRISCAIPNYIEEKVAPGVAGIGRMALQRGHH
jgi:hypothetical protein